MTSLVMNPDAAHPGLVRAGRLISLLSILSREGRTTAGIPVYNVCVPLLRERYPERPPYRLIEVPTEAAT